MQMQTKGNMQYDWVSQAQVSIKRTVSIERPYFKIFKRSLLNVPYDLHIGRVIR